MPSLFSFQRLLKLEGRTVVFHSSVVRLSQSGPTQISRRKPSGAQDELMPILEAPMEYSAS